jgi:tetratricopeptide (TPR) repeat protein
MPENALDVAYCAALYPRARDFFEQRRYEEALPVYRELHDLRWARPAAYLDAAECFLFTGDKENAARLAKETATELGEAMDYDLLRRAGDILLESGEETSAEIFYRRAIEKLRRE